MNLPPQLDRLLRGSHELPLGIYQMYMATAEQLCQLFYSPKSLTHVKELLKQLEDAGYVQHDIVPTRTRGTPYYYMVGEKGVRYLVKIGYDAYLPDMPKTKREEHFDHKFELNALLASGVLLHRDSRQLYVHRLIPEHTMKRKPYIAHWEGGRYQLVPDGFIDFGIRGTHLKRGILLEYDLDSEQREKFQRKIRAYLVFLRTKAYQQPPFATQRIIVAFCVPNNPAHRDEMRQWTYEELSKADVEPEVWYAFRFASVEKPFSASVWLEPIWYTVADTPPQALLAV